MRYALLTAALLCLSLTAAARAADAGPLEGKWELTSSEKDGKALPAGTVRTVTGDKYAISLKGKETASGTLKLDAKASPAAIDATRAGSDKAMLGIYEINGDEQKVCFAPPGKPRPTAFTSKDGHTLSVWKKVK